MRRSYDKRPHSTRSGSGPVSEGRAGTSAGGQVYALVEWVSGAYTGTFTENVKLEWVKDYKEGDSLDESFVIEWRVAPQPRAGWPVYDGKIHYVSDDLQFLKKRREELEESHSDEPQRGISVSSPDWKKLVDQAVQRALLDNAKPSTPSTPRSRNPPSNEPEKVIVGKALVLPKVKHTLAMNAPSPGRMIGLLLRQSFSRRRLIKSSYAGQHRTTANGRVQKPMLKKYQKMADIQGFVLERFPHLSQSNFGATVNSFLGEKPNKKSEIEYVQESDSDVSDGESGSS